MAVTANTFQTGSVSGLYSTLGAIQRDRFSRALERPAERLAQETESVRVRLSAFGQARSATATVQASARELQNGSAITSAASAKEAAGAFVESVNSARTTLKQLASSPQILQDDATLPGISHNTNIHDFFKQKHIPVPADQPDGSDEDTAELPVNKP